MYLCNIMMNTATLEKNRSRYYFKYSTCKLVHSHVASFVYYKQCTTYNIMFLHYFLSLVRFNTDIRRGRPVIQAVVINDPQLISVSLETKQITFYKEIIVK